MLVVSQNVLRIDCLQLADEEISKSIKKEFSGDIEDALLAIVDVARNIYEYFAKQLHRSMAGIGTDDTTLIRVIVSRSEVRFDPNMLSKAKGSVFPPLSCTPMHVF